MDLRRDLRLCVSMDDGKTDKLARICTRIGMLMEDASTDALTIGSMGSAERTRALERLGVAIEEMQSLLTRARKLDL